VARRAVRDVHQLCPAGGAAHQGHLAGRAAQGLRQGLQGRSCGASVHRGRLDSDHEGIVAIATANPGTGGTGPDPDLEADGYTLRRTATTLPRIEALLPSMGS